MELLLHEPCFACCSASMKPSFKRLATGVSASNSAEEQPQSSANARCCTVVGTGRESSLRDPDNFAVVLALDDTGRGGGRLNALLAYRGS